MKVLLLNAAAFVLLCPLVSGQEIILRASDADVGDFFGRSVAISGSTAIVGAYQDDDDGENSGSAYLFDTSTGTQIAKLRASDAAGDDYFGWSVAISGTIAIVGAYQQEEDANGWDNGAAYLFDTTTGAQIAKLLASDGATQDRFGNSVAISDTTAIVGARHVDVNGQQDSGAAYLFDISVPSAPVEIAKLTPSGGGAANDDFGYSVAISGNLAIVGAPLNDETANDAGAAYLFDAATGVQLFKLLSIDGTVNDELGASVDISGNTAIVSAHKDNPGNGAWSGSAYLFNATNGAQLFKLTPSDGASNDYFAASVAINGTNAIVGSPHDDDNDPSSGSAYLFDTTTGTQITKLLASDGEQTDQFGMSVSISDVIVIVGAYGDDDIAPNSGSAYLPDTDCNHNGLLDGLDILNDPSLDCDQNGYIDDCELASGIGDCNLNGLFDACENLQDCNANLIPDICEGLPDCDSDELPDECEIASGNDTDLNNNDIPDSCECQATNYCPPSPNSAGAGVQINITGIPSVSLNSLGIAATGGPTNQPGLFFHGPGTARQAFGEGIRCVSTPILRVGPPVFFNGSGNTSKQLDMNANALNGIQPADTRYFQLWYRDPPGGSYGFNLSNGLEITFCL